VDSENPIFEGIIKAVDESGFHEVSFKVLEENVFSQGHNPRRSAKEQLLIWAVENKVNYEYKTDGGDNIVRFYRKTKK
jgi:hypothetical protein